MNMSTLQVRLQSGFIFYLAYKHNISTTLLCALRDYKNFHNTTVKHFSLNFKTKCLK